MPKRTPERYTVIVLIIEGKLQDAGQASIKEVAGVIANYKSILTKIGSSKADTKFKTWHGYIEPSYSKADSWAILTKILFQVSGRKLVTFPF